MIAHAAFFKALSNLRETDAQWHQVFAGLCVLRLVDSFKEYPSRAAANEPTTIRSAQLAAARMSEGDCRRAPLLRILELLKTQGKLTREIGKELLAYGKSLDLEGEWALAADVFQTAAASFDQHDDTELVIEASTALGAAARNTGDWNLSDRGYANAQHLADTIGNRALSLTVRVGVAGSHMLHGNLPAAEDELEGVMAEARQHSLQNVEALALHNQASVAHLRGDYQRAIHLAYRSLELNINQTDRERILGDIAAAYAGLGMREAARNGYSIVAVTSPHQWVRWQATINLMELAISDGDERLFDDYVGQMEDAALDPRLSSYFLYFRGLGFQRFGRENAEFELRRALERASTNHLHQLAFEIEQSLKSVEPASTDDRAAAVEIPAEENEELQRIAEVLAHLRDAALVDQA
jgi:tetratricopeptide (TPR) repeat protein